MHRMHRGIFYMAEGAGAGNAGGGDGKAGGEAGGAGAGGGQGTDVAALNARLAELERQKSALEKDLHKEREEKGKKADEAKTATEKAAAAKKAALDGLRAAGFDVPGDDPATEVAAKLKAMEEEKRKAADQERETRLSRLTIERELLKAMAGKVEDLEYALYKAGRTAAFSDLKVEGDKVSGIEAVVKELSDAGILKAGKDDGQQKKAPGTGGQPPLQGDKYPWRDPKIDWDAFLKLPWATQEEAKKTDPEFVKNLEAVHFRK